MTPERVVSDLLPNKHDHQEACTMVTAKTMNRTACLAVGLMLLLAAMSDAKAACTDPSGSGVDWSGCDLSNLDLSFIGLSGANLTGANLAGTRLDSAEMTGINLTNANLKLASLFYSHLGKANFTGADLTGADLTSAHLQDADLNGAGIVNLTRVGRAISAQLSDQTAADAVAHASNEPARSCL